MYTDTSTGKWTVTEQIGYNALVLAMFCATPVELPVRRGCAATSPTFLLSGWPEQVEAGNVPELYEHVFNLKMAKPAVRCCLETAHNLCFPHPLRIFQYPYITLDVI
jgi:hypothetical protein